MTFSMNNYGSVSVICTSSEDKPVKGDKVEAYNPHVCGYVIASVFDGADLLEVDTGDAYVMAGGTWTEI